MPESPLRLIQRRRELCARKISRPFRGGYADVRLNRGALKLKDDARGELLCSYHRTEAAAIDHVGKWIGEKKCLAPHGN
jgi:5-methylcytosine-specific restriction endonuclease McrA